MIGIIGAMSVEVEGIRALMTDKEETVVSGIRFVSGKLGKNEAVTAVCGIGKVFAAICAEAMIMRFDPDVVINTGVGGSLDPKLKIGDIAIADKVVQHDMDTSPIGDPKGLLSGINKIYLESDKKVSEILSECVKAEGIDTMFGTVASGDQFIASKERKDEIVGNFGAVVCEMEGAAIGHVCYVNGKAFAVLRAVSDSADDSAHMDYPEFAKMAAENYVKVILRFANIY